MKSKFEWENIFKVGGNKEVTLTLRAKVIGGWIVKNIYYWEKVRSETMVFVPDSKHQWEIVK